MRSSDRPETARDESDRRGVAGTAGKARRRFGARIRDWLVAVVLVALVAAGMAQLIRARRLQAVRALLEALRLQEEDAKKADEFIKAMDKREAEWNKLEAERDGLKRKVRQFEETPKSRDGVSPEPDRKGLPVDIPTVL